MDDKKLSTDDKLDLIDTRLQLISFQVALVMGALLAPLVKGCIG